MVCLICLLIFYYLKVCIKRITSYSNKAKKNPERLFVQKSNNHRGIKIQPLSELDLETPGTFVQEFVHKPLLIGLKIAKTNMPFIYILNFIESMCVDGHKFDIGVYTIISSIEPLRVYIFDGDILFR